MMKEGKLAIMRTGVSGMNECFHPLPPTRKDLTINFRRVYGAEWRGKC
jgi:hypothetical protein